MQKLSRIGGLLPLPPLLGPPVSAQSIDAGRGEVPLTVPAGYDASMPTPLIVALHGYTGNGAAHDRSWGISALADKYNFLTIAPDGEREPEGTVIATGTLRAPAATSRVRRRTTPDTSAASSTRSSPGTTWTTVASTSSGTPTADS